VTGPTGPTGADSTVIGPTGPTGTGVTGPTGDPGTANLPTVTVNSGSVANTVLQYATVQTTGSNITTILSYPLADNTLYLVEGLYTGRDIAGTERCAYGRFACAYRQSAGDVNLQGSVQTTFSDIETTAAMDADITGSGTNLLFRVTGKAATTINWDLIATIKPRS
jgi:hypothetical protein